MHPRVRLSHYIICVGRDGVNTSSTALPVVAGLLGSCAVPFDFDSDARGEVELPSLIKIEHDADELAALRLGCTLAE